MLLRPEDLQVIDNKIYEANKEELIARQLISLKTDVPAGAETYAYDMMTRSGAAKILANGADDLPMVDADLRRSSVNIYSIATSMSISVQEVRQAAMNSMNIDAAKADICRRAIAEKENQLAFIGDKDYNIQGLTNAEGIQVQAADNGAAGTATWATKTPKEIVKDIRKAKNAVNKLPGHTADTLVLTPEGFEALEEVYNEYSDKTILDFIRSQGWFSRIIQTSDFNGVGLGGTDSFMVFDSSPGVVQLLLPMDIVRHETEYKFPNHKVPFEERFGGVIVRYPLALVRVDGI